MSSNRPAGAAGLGEGLPIAGEGLATYWEGLAHNAPAFTIELKKVIGPFADVALIGERCLAPVFSNSR